MMSKAVVMPGTGVGLLLLQWPDNRLQDAVDRTRQTNWVPARWCTRL